MTSEEIQNEIDKATTAVTIDHYISWYAELQRIKCSPNREEEIERAIRFREAALNIWNIDVSKIKEAGIGLANKTVDKDNDVEKLSEGDIEIPSNILPNMVEWMRNKGITDSDILDCILFMMKKDKKEN